MAKRKSATVDGTKKRRGGRKPGEWRLLTPDKLRDYRDANKISRARMATMLGVSSTSVQNWETGAVASMKIQQRIAELLAAGPSALLPQVRKTSLWDMAKQERNDPAIQSTGAIVAGYLASHGHLSQEDLVGLIRSVRQALA